MSRARKPGKRIIDATKQMRTKVYRCDIVGAKRRDPGHCPTANSIRRRRGVIDVRVGAGVVYIEYRDYVVRYFLSDNDVKIINGWDDNADTFVDGYAVTLLPPPVGKRIGDRVGQAHGSKVRSGKNDSVRCRDHKRHVNQEPDDEAA